MNTTLNTTNWAEFPFTLNEINFVSKVNPMSSMFMQITNVGHEVFSKMNKDAISDLLGDPSKLSVNELISELNRVNDGATTAILELAGN